MEIRIPKILLLSFYSIIPISLLAVFIDKAFLRGEMSNHLPQSPESLFLFTIIFVLPHVVASSLSFFDSEYVSNYKKKLLLPSALIVLGVLFLPALIGAQLFYLIYIAWTQFHAVGQQLGITLIMTKSKSKSYLTWKWSALAIALLANLESYIPNIGNHAVKPLVQYGVLALLIPFTISNFLVQHKCQDRVGKYYVWSNYALVISAWIFYNLNYPFFPNLMTRIIHDFSAFAFYAAHDQNRNAVKIQNFLYKPFMKLGVPALLLCPILAIAFAFPITYFRELEWGYSLTMMIAFFHYYTDSFTWKKDSLHRKFIFVK